MAISKVYFTINEISVAIGVAIPKIRRWEKKYKVHCNQRVEGSTKRYLNAQLIRFKEIKELEERKKEQEEMRSKNLSKAA